MEYTCSLTDLKNILSKLNPGDKVLITDGIYDRLSLTIKSKGTFQKRIFIKAKNPGKVVITGTSKISIQGEYTTVANFMFNNGGKTNAIEIRGKGNRLTGCDINFSKVDGPVVMIGMKNNRIDHCIFHDFNKSDRWIQKDPSSKSEDYILFDHNIVKNRPVGKEDNGYETLQLRNEDNNINSRSMVVNNYFEKCDGEIEMISIKSSENIVHKNTIQSTKATITLRSGRGNIISTNKFLQDNVSESGGLRITGADHIIFKNLFKETDRSALNIISGTTSKPSYQQVLNLKVLENVMINNNCDIELGSKKGNLVPTNVEFNDNIVYKTTKDDVFKQGSDCKNLTFTTNKYYATNFGKNPKNSGILSKPSDFDIKMIDENKYGNDEEVGPQWDKNPEDSELPVEVDIYYNNLKNSILAEIQI